MPRHCPCRHASKTGGRGQEPRSGPKGLGRGRVAKPFPPPQQPPLSIGRLRLLPLTPQSLHICVGKFFLPADYHFWTRFIIPNSSANFFFHKSLLHDKSFSSLHTRPSFAISVPGRNSKIFVWSSGGSDIRHGGEDNPAFTRRSVSRGVASSSFTILHSS